MRKIKALSDKLNRMIDLGIKERLLPITARLDRLEEHALAPDEPEEESKLLRMVGQAAGPNAAAHAVANWLDNDDSVPTDEFEANSEGYQEGYLAAIATIRRALRTP